MLKRALLILVLCKSLLVPLLWGQDTKTNLSQFLSKNIPFNITLKIQPINPTSNYREFYKDLQLVQVELQFTKKTFQSVYESYTFQNRIIEDFESQFPRGLWTAYDGDNEIFGNYFWGVVDPVRHTNPTHCAWCTAAGSNTLPAPNRYPDNCNSWMVYGPIDLSRADSALVKFSVWLDSEPYHDYLFWMASVDDSNFFGQGISGKTNEWQELFFDLTNVYQLGNLVGKSEVWIAFLFYSDELNTAEGAYLDDISIQIDNLFANEINVKISNIDTTSFPKIQSYVNVTDETGYPILDLTDQNFRVTENNINQTPIQVSLADSTRSVSFALVMDYSGSMVNSNAVKDAEKAAHAFVDLKNTYDYGSVFKFNNNVFMIQGLTSDTLLLHQAINTPIAGSGTALFDAIWEAVNELNKALGNRTIIALTDGNDNDSSHKLKNVISHADTNNISVYTIGLGEDVDEIVLKQIADSTGGYYYYAPNSSQLDSIYQTISKALSNQYYVSYVTSNAHFDGTNREVIIDVNYDFMSGCDTAYYRAPGSDTVIVWISDSLLASSGDTLIVPINISNVMDGEIYSISLTLLYDDNAILAKPIYIPGIIPSDWSVMENILTPEHLFLSMAGSSALDTSGCLLNLVFKIIGNPGDSTVLQFAAAILNEGFPPLKTKDGFLLVKDIFVSGYVGYYPCLNSLIAIDFDTLYNDPDDFDLLFRDSVKVFVDGVKIKLSDTKKDSIFTSNNGYYEFLDLPEINFNITPSKIDQFNNSISAYDASLILRYDTKFISLTPYQMIAADVTGNGFVTSFDASYVLRKAVGLIPEFPIKNDWTFVPHDFIINSTNWASAPRFRLYQEAKESKINQNFFAIVYGDVSANWKPTKGILTKNEVRDLALSYLSVDNFIGFCANRTNLTIGVHDVSNVYSFSLSLTYDTEILALLEVRATESNQEYSLVYNRKGDTLKIAAAGVMPLSGACSLLNIEFELQDNANINALDHITITDFSLNEIEADHIDKKIYLNISHLLPSEFHLSQNYPNPFNICTLIKYQLPEETHVKIEIFNLLGHQVRTLVNNKMKKGYHQVYWDGHDDFNGTVSSGVYIYRFQADRFVSNRKMVILK